jgi:two-component system, response regulator PdtaR
MKPTMLVIDDKAIIRMDLVDVAHDAGFQTVEAENASEALRILETRDDILVVFTDIGMPGQMMALNWRIWCATGGRLP